MSEAIKREKQDLLKWIIGKKKQFDEKLTHIFSACVALSRAKMGFYVVGDFDMFASVSSFWKIVLEEVRHQKAIGNSISLVNAGKTTIVKTISDFNKV